METKYKKENIITPLYTLNVEVILHSITLSLYDTVNDTETIINHITINMRTKYKKVNKITPLYTLNLKVILHYITLTIYDIVNDT